MNAKDVQLVALRKAFDDLDFTQPKAHEVFSELFVSLDGIVSHPDDTVWREFFFFNLGCSYALANLKIKTIPPVQFIVKESEGKK